MNEKEFDKRFVNAIIQIRHQMKMDKIICGDAFIEFTDRKIEVISPDKVVIKSDYCPKCKKKIKTK